MCIKHLVISPLNVKLLNKVVLAVKCKLQYYKAAATFFPPKSQLWILKQHLLIFFLQFIGSVHWWLKNNYIILALSVISIIKLCKTLNTYIFRHEIVKFTDVKHHQKTSTTAVFILKISVQKPVLVKPYLISLWLTNSLNETTNCALIKWLNSARS